MVFCMFLSLLLRYWISCNILSLYVFKSVKVTSALLRMVIFHMLCSWRIYEELGSQDPQGINTKNKIIFQSLFLPLRQEIFPPIKKYMFQFSSATPEMITLPQWHSSIVSNAVFVGRTAFPMGIQFLSSFTSVNSFPSVYLRTNKSVRLLPCLFIKMLATFNLTFSLPPPIAIMPCTSFECQLESWAAQRSLGSTSALSHWSWRFSLVKTATSTTGKERKDCAYFV